MKFLEKGLATPMDATFNPRSQTLAGSYSMLRFSYELILPHLPSPIPAQATLAAQLFWEAYSPAQDPLSSPSLCVECTAPDTCMLIPSHPPSICDLLSEAFSAYII